MAYTPDYGDADLSASLIDNIVKIVLVVGVFATPIVLILIYRWLRRTMR